MAFKGRECWDRQVLWKRIHSFCLFTPKTPKPFSIPPPFTHAESKGTFSGQLRFYASSFEVQHNRVATEFKGSREIPFFSRLENSPFSGESGSSDMAHSHDSDERSRSTSNRQEIVSDGVLSKRDEH